MTGLLKYKCIFLVLTFFCVLNAQAQRHYVTMSGAGTKTGTSWSDAYDSVALRTALRTAIYGDTFWVAAGTYTPANSRDSAFYLPTGMVVIGGFAGTETNVNQRNYILNPTILSGDIGLPGTISDNCYNVLRFNHADSTTVLDGFTITHGNANNTLFAGGNYSSCGGGIYNDGSGAGVSNPTIAHCTFTHNSCLWAGAAVYNSGRHGGANRTVFYYCIFSYDSTTNKGAGIYNDADSGTCAVNISRCLFAANSIEGYEAFGGGIYNSAYAGVQAPVITHSIFKANSAGLGEAIYNIASYGGICRPVITNCLFYNNHNNAIFGSGAVYITAQNAGICSAVITNCTFTHNIGFGGSAVYAEAITFGTCNTVINNGIIWNDSIHSYAYMGEVVAENARVVINNTDIKGGWMGPGTQNISANPLFADTTIDNFQLQRASPCVAAGKVSYLPKNDTTEDLPGHVRTTNGKVDMGAYQSKYDNCATFKNIDTTLNAFQSYTFNGTTCNYSGTFIALLQNKAGCDSMVTLHLTIRQGRLYVTPGGAGVMDGTSWSNAYDSVAFRNAIKTEYSGDTFWVAAGTYKPENSRDSCFNIHNRTKLYGGFAGTETKLAQRNFTTHITILSGDIGIPVTDTDNCFNIVRFNYADSTSCIDGFTISHGTGSLPYFSLRSFIGAGIYNFGYPNIGSAPVIANCTFDDDTCGAGGAIFNADASPYIFNCTFNNCRAQQEGGAIFNESSGGICSPIIKQCIFNKCKAGMGGAIYNSSGGGNCSPVITGCTFSNNAGNPGGAIYNSSASPAYMRPVITYCTFSNNYSGNGGAIFNASDGPIVPVISHCIFNGNTTQVHGWGAAIYNTNKSVQYTIDNSIFFNNKADEGGAVYTDTYYGRSDVTFFNCLFYKNVSTDVGGALFNNGVNVHVINCTFSNNTGLNGGAMYNAVSNCHLLNTILWKDSATASGNEVYDYFNVDSLFNCTIRGGWTGGGLHNISTDPLFANALTDSFKLKSTSPCINAGRNAFLPVGDSADLAGNQRIQKHNVDMGAYESGYVPSYCSASSYSRKVYLCKTLSYFVNGHAYKVNGTYYDTLTNKAGCDSTLTTQLIFLSDGSNVNASLCSGSSYLFNGKYYTATGLYLDTLKNKAACDSVVTLNLRVNDNYRTRLNATVCAGHTYMFNGKALSAPGIYCDTFKSIAGCDSLVLLSLSVNSASYYVINDTFCAGRTDTINGAYYTTAGIYYDTLFNTQGCDSVIAIHINTRNRSFISLYDTICHGQSYTFDSVIYNASGAYTAHYTNRAGCDSAVTLNLAVHIPAVTQTNTHILNAGDSITINHKVYRTQGVFKDTLYYSSPAHCDSVVLKILILIATGTHDVTEANTLIIVYPNPFSNYIHIELPQAITDARITITDIIGRQVFAQTTGTADPVVLDMRTLTPGMYTIQVQTATGTYTTKLMKAL